LCGDVKPTAAQRDLYKIAHEEITHNMSLIKPGLSYREFSDKAYPLAEKYKAQRYGVMAHGIGLCDEAPAIYPTGDYDAMGVDYEGVLQPGMTICIESYIGEVGGDQGVKLEDQVLVTDTGFENLTRYPYEKIFMES
jgi:Xaa-Pro aminopeptidase